MHKQLSRCSIVDFLLRRPPNRRSRPLTLKQLRQTHCQILTNGLQVQTDLSVIRSFLALCVQSGHVDYGASLLREKNRLPCSDLWNSVIKAAAEAGWEQEALRCYVKMLQEGAWPQKSTFLLVLRLCVSSLAVGFGEGVHCRMLKMGFGLDAFLLTGLLDFYAKNGDLGSAEKVFEEMTERDVVAWNSMLSAYSRHGHVEDARKMFDQMPERNTVSWNTIIYCYWRCEDDVEARRLFEMAPVKDVATWNSMITGYCKSGDLGSAWELFARMDTKNSISWNTMISGCVQSREFGKALSVFNGMQAENVRATEVTMISLLSACAHLGALDVGRWIHAYIEKESLKVDVVLGTALVDMYMKCGSIDAAMQIFHDMHRRNIFCWNAIISGLAMNGLGEEAIDVFSSMEKENMKPDHVTFVGLLSGCSHSGLVAEGLEFFYQMPKKYGIEPRIEHYGCVVDLLGRAGLLDRAQEVVETMPMIPNGVTLGSLLRACRGSRNNLLKEKIIKKMMDLDPSDGANYVLLSNLYAAANRWADVEVIRELMRERGVRKTPGCSSIELNNVVHEFVVGDSSHPQFERISKFLDEVSKKLRLLGYESDTGPVLHDIDEEEKESSVRYHSEKVAIAFGIMNTSPGSVVRVVKNLRMCSDCHASAKLIAKLFGRRIIVRDRSRFHHFSEAGTCSCKDYW
ncbi:unnamed protein product [Victoria cruziana]